jgi:hypothetical protein
MPSGKNPPDNDSTVVCRNGKPVPQVVFISPKEFIFLIESRNKANRKDNVSLQNLDAERKGYYCVQACSYQHEESHIKDILAQNPNICVGVQNGTTIYNTDPNTDLLNSEQRAHQISAECLAKCKQTCPSEIVNNEITKNNKWIEDHKYE